MLAVIFKNRYYPSPLSLNVTSYKVLHYATPWLSPLCFHKLILIGH